MTPRVSPRVGGPVLATGGVGAGGGVGAADGGGAGAAAAVVDVVAVVAVLVVSVPRILATSSSVNTGTVSACFCIAATVAAVLGICSLCWLTVLSVRCFETSPADGGLLTASAVPATNPRPPPIGNDTSIASPTPAVCSRFGS